MPTQTLKILCPRCNKPVAEVDHAPTSGFALEATQEVSVHCQCGATVKFWAPNQCTEPPSHRDLTRAVV